MPNDPAGGPGARVADIGERALIARLQSRLGPAPDWLVVDVGDDAAVYEPVRNRLEVMTTDAVVDGVHIDSRFVAPEAIGHRAVAVNLSDLAAMGAAPRLITLSLALPPALPLEAFDGIVTGALALADRAGARLVGGNITRTTGPLVVDVTAVGSVHRRRILRRAGARAGDHIFVSGTLGDARAGLEALQDAGAGACERWPAVTARYLLPEPRIRLGLALGVLTGVTAAIDLSDGLADGLSHLVTGQALGCRIDAASVPLSAEARERWQARGADPVLEAVAGGDDYELLFTIRPREIRRVAAAARAAGGLPLTRIGAVTREPGCWLVASGGQTPITGGYEHFAP